MRAPVAFLLIVLPFAARAQRTVAVQGVVYDSVARHPLGGASVIALPLDAVSDSLFHNAVTDASGRFVVAGLPLGRYALVVEHPSLDSLGLSVPPRRVMLSGRDTTITLAIPSGLGFARLACGAAAADSTGALVGRVMNVTGGVVPSAVVVVSWSDFDVDRATKRIVTRRLTANVQSDSSGVYRACGLPVARSLLVQAQAGADVQSGVVEEQIGPTRVLLRDFSVTRAVQFPAFDSTRSLAVGRVDLPPGGASGVAASAADTSVALGPYVLRGYVRGVDGSPVASAQVRLFGSNRATNTEADGAFRLNGLPGGTQGIEVVALGFYPHRLRFEVGASMADVNIRLEKTAVVLDSMRVVATRVNATHSLANKEFDDRSHAGHGVYYGESDIARRRPFLTADIFRGNRVAHVEGLGDELYLVSNRGSASIGAAATLPQGGRPCVLDVYIDGQRVQPTDVNTVPPEALHGAELYSSATIPAKYASNPCGALFLWTK